MTAIVALRGTQLYIKVETSDASGVFAHPCLINTDRGIKFTSSSNKEVIPDCDNPNDPAWQEVIKDALSAAIDGAGKHDNKAETIAFYSNYFKSPDAKNVQVWLGTLGYWQGAFKLVNWEIKGSRNSNCDVSVTLESHGVLGDFTAA